MHRLGLALSGGGFRATLYHLGVARFLRDAEILPKITHITTVSGGSVLGAHLALNWDKYCGSDIEFEQAANEIVRFVQLDVRNRIVRRFPFASAINTVRRILRLGTSRRLTRPGLLEAHYERFLYGDTSLFQLPERPRLHILSTNLSDGCLCSFNRDGLVLQRRARGRRDNFEKMRIGLATVPMAVAASSAFPGFFPPLELNARDVGADEGEFSRQAFTDGGVIDNLGLRAFRSMEQSWGRDIPPLTRDDFLELDAATSALMSEQNLPEDTPLSRLQMMLLTNHPKRTSTGRSRNQDDPADAMVAGLWEIIRNEELFRDPTFENIDLTDPSAQSLHNYLRSSDREAELSDRLWLNREIIESALRQVIGKPCLRTSSGDFDSILVSDAGSTFKVAGDSGAGGLLRTGIRSSDILMDRVWQLELEAFENSSGVLFFPLSEVVERSDDPNAPHPEIQRQAARIRTDYDRFSELEIAALVQHGYCVSRKTIRAHNDIFSADIPTGPPWDPLRRGGTDGDVQAAPVEDLSRENQAMPTARRLQDSSSRRIVSTLFSVRDWPTYIWLPLLALVFLSLPYWVYTLNKKSQQQTMVLTAIAETSPVYGKILELLEYGPAPSIAPAEFQVVDLLPAPDNTGFQIISDTRIFDLRRWTESNDAKVAPSAHLRFRVSRNQAAGDNTHLRLQLLSADEQLLMAVRTASLNPVYSRKREADGKFLWELDLDLRHVPLGSDTEVVADAMIASELAEHRVDGGYFQFMVPIDTGLVQIWVLMPVGRAYDNFEITSFPLGKPELAQTIVPETSVELPYGSIATFRMINPKDNYRYECSWKWRDAPESGN